MSTSQNKGRNPAIASSKHKPAHFRWHKSPIFVLQVQSIVPAWSTCLVFVRKRARDHRPKRVWFHVPAMYL
ncbi:hypothetical protein PENSPDRAFT_433033 [Peniophora sp. CONT]|nr:hypothetical protein PENSPDRAFT_433033 [Peniophora sp. CONT]